MAEISIRPAASGRGFLVRTCHGASRTLPALLVTAVVLAVAVLSCASLETKRGPLTYEEHLQLAVIYESKGEFESALKEFHKALEMDATTARVHFAAANVHLKIHQYEAAERMYLEAIELDPTEGSFYNNLAWVYIERSRYVDAETMVRKAMSYDPAGDYVYFDTLGVILTRRGEYKRAEKVLVNAELFAPYGDKTSRIHIYTHMLDLYLLTGDINKAAEVKGKLEGLTGGGGCGKVGKGSSWFDMKMKRIIYGINPIREAFKAAAGRPGHGPRFDRLVTAGRGGPEIDAILAAAAALKLPVERTDRAGLDCLAGSVSHQGAVLVISGAYAYSDLEDLISIWNESGEKAFFLILDSIQDPQNLGSILRSADCAGVHGVIIAKDRAAGVTAAVVKASAGATEHVPVARVTNIAATIERLKRENVWVAAVEAGSDSLYSADLSGDIALVIGSEGRGIGRLVRRHCDLSVGIPMRGRLGSLNAAQAASVVLFEALRQRSP